MSSFDSLFGDGGSKLSQVDLELLSFLLQSPQQLGRQAIAPNRVKILSCFILII